MIKKEDKKLTEKQRKFLNEYIKSGDVKASALKAGYSKNNALKMGEENLKKENVRKYIKKALKSDITEDEKIEYAALSYKNKIEKDADCEKCSEQGEKLKSNDDLKDMTFKGEAVSKNKDFAWDSEDKRGVHRFSGDEKSFKENASDDGEMIIEKKEKVSFTFDKEEKKDTDDEISGKNKNDRLTSNDKKIKKSSDNEESSYTRRDFNSNNIKLVNDAEYKEDFNEELTDTYDKKTGIAGEEEVMEYLTSLIRGSSATEKEKLKAAELMGKKYGMWSEKIDLSESGPKIIKVDIV